MEQTMYEKRIFRISIIYLKITFSLLKSDVGPPALKDKLVLGFPSTPYLFFWGGRLKLHDSF